MYDKFLPDHHYHMLNEITPELLTALGIKGVVMDIDNTIVTYDDPEPTPEAILWLDAVTGAGIRVSFVSNNNWDRVNGFNQKLNFPAYAKSAKPLTHNIKKAMARMGTEKDSTAFIGDQIFTDVWAGKQAGLTVFLVDPIKDKTDALIRFKRFLERPVKRAFEKKKRSLKDKE